MFSTARALAMNVAGSEPLPNIPELVDLYAWGCTPRRGEIIMIAGRSGSQKSGFALWLCAQWGLKTLYFAGDMTAFQASSRLASMQNEMTTSDVEAILRGGMGGRGPESLLEPLRELSIDFCFDSPINFHGIDAELEAYVEIHNAFPEVIVVDNFMDIAGNESDYASQMASFQELTALARNTGSTLLVLHHATDKGDRTANPHDLAHPPTRREIKGGMSEKPELCMTVAMASDGSDVFRIAVVKQRMGRSDPGALNPVKLQAFPYFTTFKRFEEKP